MKRLIYFLMALLGFGASGCSVAFEDNLPFDDDAVCEYGCPHVTFNISARVVDEAGTPIKGIEVYREGVPLGYNSHISDEEGRINIIEWGYPMAPSQIELVDTDGAENGGDFETLQVDLTDRWVQVSNGDGNWDMGEYVAKLGDVTMKLKATEEE